MANEKNLRPSEYKLSQEEAKKGGIASGEARRRKRDLRRALEGQFQKALDGDTRAFETIRDTAGQKPVEKVMVSEVSQDVIDEVERMVLEDDE